LGGAGNVLDVGFELRAGIRYDNAVVEGSSSEVDAARALLTARTGHLEMLETLAVQDNCQKGNIEICIYLIFNVIQWFNREQYLESGPSTMRD
jgi:hypothetical protein